ncbi:glycosyltransferase [Azoarcus communis]|uniref:glycosyltransferase family 4 protein n=1 Tax=Parazoarcus communis TaxID=41977 RepID=UPI00145923F6|nr:glycosyltransferase family 1 protein [Parazoarcus communis]NMG48120.1 glycosyltransferase [Parazoarcus communis]
MRVVLGADTIKYPLTGIGRYAFELGRGLQQHAGVDSLHFLRGNSVVSELPSSALPVRAMARADTALAIRNRLMAFPPLVAGYSGVTALRQRWALRTLRGAVFHGPNYYLPHHDGPCVATFHDLSIFRHPEFHPAVRVRYMANELPRSLERADVLITDSDFTRHEVIAYSGFAPARVLTVPLAVSAEFRPRTQSECFEVLTRHGLTYKHYFLYAGTVEPRKNLGLLLTAYERLPLAVRMRLPFVVVGFRGWCSEDLHFRLSKAQTEGWVSYLGYVSESDLHVLFSGARAFGFPSIYEGFGLPVLEAMASGVPVVCSNTSSLPEVAGGCALMCEPEDDLALSALLEKALSDDCWREQFILKGMTHAATFSWKRTVDATVEAYKLAISI